MATIQDFLDEMYDIYKSNSVYIGTANGERTLDLTIGQIFKMEETYARRDSKGNPLWYNDAKRDLYHIGDLRNAKKDLSKSRAGDCSGIIVGALRAIEAIPQTADYRARDFQKQCYTITKAELQPGDFVFDAEEKAGHIGVYSDIDTVIDSRGRDVGVVERNIANYSWKAYGRPYRFLSDAIPPLRRELYYVEGNLMKGQDVEALQWKLKKLNYEPGTIDGIFGKKTREAVIRFQETSGMKVNRPGTVGKKTWAKLFTS